ncbi:uncharacterized protein LOC131650166 [Vicia villosa]|uniref:uncharacterized protein LOC131650166 n=1 Tax=Vicia villosa TaxID=3911 RepID=UPI00273AB942|nr:uncharacterized protein LOC131650166 [Vicia villosa]
MSVLVNGSPTKEFKVERDLRQGDPLSPFLFVLVAEGLMALVKKATEIGKFEGFIINGKSKIDILQFANDTLLIDDGSWKQILAIETVLKSFETVSGLGINYHKRKLIGINISARYGDICMQVINEDVFLKTSFSPFSWWKDIVSLGRNSHKDAVVNKCRTCLGNGFTTSSWHSLWIGKVSLKDYFPSLFSMSQLQEVSVGAMRGWTVDGWC